jgi:hypothetical protein
MIDKIEAMMERGTAFRGELNQLRRATPDAFSPTLKPSRFYKGVADLRQTFGIDAILHIDQKRYGTHKVELLETGKKGMTEIKDILEQIIDADPGGCRLGRVDLAVDVRDVPLSWFREHTYVEYKQFLCAHGKQVDSEMSEMGKKVYQTLYFGKRPSCVRIYDKTAERVAQYGLLKKRAIRQEKKSWAAAYTMSKDRENFPAFTEPTLPSLNEWLAMQLPEIKQDIPQNDGDCEAKVIPFPMVTRVENQFGGRVPEDLETVGEMSRNVLEFNPFARMQFLTGNLVVPSFDQRSASGELYFSSVEWLAGIAIRDHMKDWGAQQLWAILNINRNGKRYMQKLQPFFPPAETDETRGISESDLYERYRNSISRQLAA